MATTTPSGPASSRARRSAACGVAHDLGVDRDLGRELVEQRAQRRRRQHARVVAGGEHQRVAERRERAQHRRGVLVVEDRDDRDDPPVAVRAAAMISGSDSASAAIPSGLWAPSSSVSGSLVDDLQAAGHAHVARGRRDRGLVELAEERLGGGPREREVAPLEGPRAHRPSACGSASAWTIVAPRSAAISARHRERLRVHARPEHERPPGLHDVELLARDRGDRRAQPARVLEPDAGQHLDASRGSRWWRRSGRRARPRSRPPRRRSAASSE